MTGQAPVGSPVLGVEAVYKHFGSVCALDGVSIRLASGTVWACVGENGAGKSTLARIVAGLERADSGHVTSAGPVAFVPQHPALAPELTILDNLMVGFEPLRGPFVVRSRARHRLSSVARRLGVDIDLSLRAGNATTGELRFAVLVAQVARDPTAVILDEPSVGLDSRDRERMEGAIKRLVNHGAAVLLISHDLDEVRRLAAGVTVLRGGRAVAQFEAPLSRRAIAGAMFAHTPVSTGPERRPITGDGPGPIRLHLDGLTALSPHTGVQVGPIDLEVRGGQRVALFGLREDGIQMVEALLSGELLTTSGTLSVNGKRLPARLSPGILRAAGLAHVPSDRLVRGATLRGSVEENLILHERLRLHRGGILQMGKSATFSNALLSRFRIDGTRAARLASLSGGNIQRVILSREVAWNPSVVVIAEPAAGLDLDGQEQLSAELASLAEAGTAILVLGSDLREAELFADRVRVIRNGRIVGDFDATDGASIVDAMSGEEER